MKNLHYSLKAAAVLMSAIIFLSSCASTTMINSVPSGAKVYLNGESVGTTPYQHTDTKIIFSSTAVTLEKEGYEKLNTNLTRSEEPDAGPIIGGIFIWPLWLWALKYKATRTYELKPIR